MKNLYRFNEFLLEDAKISIGDFAEDLISSMGDMKTLADEAEKKANDISELKDSPLKEKDTRKGLVGKLQDALVKLGHQTDPGANRGTFGALTKKAVNKYQKEKGLKETGEVNDELMRSILGVQGEKKKDTPFKNKEEGNEFRKWMKENHSDFKDGKEPLAEAGDYNNSTIQQAWKEYGEEYEKNK